MLDKHKRIKNLFVDFFKITELSEVNIVELKRVLVFTCRSETSPIEVRHMETNDISEATVAKETVPFREVGPCFDLVLRRDKMATSELFKEACRAPKVRNILKKKSDKNKFTNALGETKAKVFLQQQDIDTIALRKFRIGQKSNFPRKEEGTEQAAKAEKPPKEKKLLAQDV